ncbi:hypothetical protein Tco_0580797 [Tanacetum coccineum]
MESALSNRNNVGIHFLAICGKQKPLKSLVIPWRYPCGLSELFPFLYDGGETIAWLPKCEELREAADSLDWVDMMVLYFRRSAAEDRKFVSQINMLRGEMIVACQERVCFVQELETVAEASAPQKMTKFLNETQVKDDEKLLHLQNLERETELRAVEKELFIQKLLRNVPFLK